MASELAGLLARESPGAASAPLKSYPPARTLAQALSGQGFELLFLDASSNREVAFQLLSEISGLAPEIAVVALLAENDPDLILHCLRQGASEFLIRPFTSDQFEAALRKLARTRPASRLAPQSNCRIHCVVPGKGACGATTLACNLAFQLRRPGNGKVLLADMDPLTGTLAFLLRLKSSFSFLDALTRAASLDADLWKAIVTPCQGIDVLLSPENPVDAISEACDPVPVLRYARQFYQSIVLDTGGAYGDWNLALADTSDDVLLVTTNELPTLHATQRALAYLEGNGIPSSKIHLVVDRYRPDLGLPQQELATALHAEVFHVLPSDSDTINKALLEGKPAQAGSKFSKSLATLAERLAGQEAPSQKKPLLAGLFGGSVH
jgi:pilus assembly protein CpaE